MFVPHGALLIVNLPSTPVTTLIIGSPLISVLHESHDTPGVNAVTPYVGAPVDLPLGT